MSRNGKFCVVFGCRNCQKKVRLWKSEFCEIHLDMLHSDCPCPNPLRFFAFPKNETVKKDWIKAVNRFDFKPSNYSVVCSAHFVDGKPTPAHPVPTVSMQPRTFTEIGYTPKKRLQSIEILENPIHLNKKVCFVTKENELISFVDNLYTPDGSEKKVKRTFMKMKPTCSVVLNDSTSTPSHYQLSRVSNSGGNDAIEQIINESFANKGTCQCRCKCKTSLKSVKTQTDANTCTRSVSTDMVEYKMEPEFDCSFMLNDLH